MFGLTRQEKIVVLFLCALALAGLGAGFLFKKYSRLKELPYLETKPKIVNINNATAQELIALPGIGAALAGRIIEYRNENGAFEDLQGLSQVKGIRNQTIEKLKDLAVVE